MRAVSPLLLQRYELKYIIPHSLVEPISKAIEDHCELDYHSQISPDQFYVINSLYFDTPNFSLLMNKRKNLDPSFSLRVRSYGRFPVAPYYAEIKLKRNDFSNKMRAKLATEDWAEVLRSGEIPEGMDGRSREYLSQFLFLLETHAATPKILTQYRRKAYLSQVDGYARVTFDRDLRYQMDVDYDLKPDERQMNNYDCEDIFPHPDQDVILELKCEKRVPLWMIDLIRRFDLQRRSFSKYGNAINEAVIPPLPPTDLQPMFHSYARGAR